MTRDLLAVLARLRGAEVLAARRQVMEEAGLHQAAEQRAQAAASAVVEEGRHGEDYGAWLPRGMALRAAAAAEAERAARRVSDASAALAVARAAERAVEALAEMREEDARRTLMRAEQRVLDEAGARRAQPQGLSPSA